MVCRENSAIERAGLVAAVEQAADAIVITDTAGTVLYANPAFTTLTGYTKAETLGEIRASSSRARRRQPFTRSFGALSGRGGFGTAR